MIDALLGLTIMLISVSYLDLLITSYYREESKTIEMYDYTQEELPCDIWCKTGLYDYWDDSSFSHDWNFNAVNDANGFDVFVDPIWFL